MQHYSRKETAWRKNRKFSEIHGGRTSLKITDGIFRRVHSLKRPARGEHLPLFISENPSRDFFHPMDSEDLRQELNRLPHSHWRGITHVWQPRVKRSEYESGTLPLAAYICGSGVQAVVLYPFPRDGIMPLGRGKPDPRCVSIYQEYGALVEVHADGWTCDWSKARLTDFYLEQLLFHEIGHHVDKYNRRRRHTPANSKCVEEFADQYAFLRKRMRRDKSKGQTM